jgi:hypothetical protein
MEDPVKMLSTGVPSTLGNWHALCQAMFGADSSATKFIKDKMDEQGPDEQVLSDEGQLLYALAQMALGDP